MGGKSGKKCIPLEVYNKNGYVNTNLRYVLNRWENEFSSLFNFNTKEGVFKDDFWFNIIKEKIVK